jgi:hypothetical protein
MEGKRRNEARFEVFTAVVMKSINFWDITTCSPLSTDVSEEHIASIFRVEEISSARNQKASRTYFLDSKDEGDMYHRNVG